VLVRHEWMGQKGDNLSLTARSTDLLRTARPPLALSFQGRFVTHADVSIRAFVSFNPAGHPPERIDRPGLAPCFLILGSLRVQASGPLPHVASVCWSSARSSFRVGHFGRSDRCAQQESGQEARKKLSVMVVPSGRANGSIDLTQCCSRPGRNSSFGLQVGNIAVQVEDEPVRNSRRQSVRCFDRSQDRAPLPEAKGSELLQCKGCLCRPGSPTRYHRQRIVRPGL
jgi:hypothetical protein